VAVGGHRLHCVEIKIRTISVIETNDKLILLKLHLKFVC
jgi:hypothetical protein